MPGAGVLDFEHAMAVAREQTERQRAIAADGLDAVLRDVEEGLLDLGAIGGDVCQTRLDLDADIDVQGLCLGSCQCCNARHDLAEIDLASRRRTQPDDVREAAHEVVQLRGPSDDDANRPLEVGAVVRRQLTRIAEAGVRAASCEAPTVLLTSCDSMRISFSYAAFSDCRSSSVSSSSR